MQLFYEVAREERMRVFCEPDISGLNLCHSKLVFSLFKKKKDTFIYADVGFRVLLEGFL